MRARYILRRLVLLVLSLFVSSFVIFAAMYAAPGNALAALSGGRSLPPEAIAALEERYHLNEPLLVQYWYWLKAAVQGDFGTSIALRENVSSAIAARLPVTLELVIYAALIITVVGIALGVISGIRPGFLDKTIVLGATTAAAIPAFVAAIALTAFFSVQLGWFPVIGEGSGGLLDRVYHLTLPAIALAVSAVAIVARVTRAAIREEAGKEHVQTALSRGLPRSKIIRSHILRNAAIPITTVTGITIASLIAISAVVETAFGLNGIGAFLVSSANSKDLAVVQAISLLLVMAFIVVNLFVDLLYAVLDPRVSVPGDSA